MTIKRRIGDTKEFKGNIFLTNGLPEVTKRPPIPKCKAPKEDRSTINNPITYNIQYQVERFEHCNKLTPTHLIVSEDIKEHIVKGIVIKEVSKDVYFDYPIVYQEEYFQDLKVVDCKGENIMFVCIL